MFKSLEAVAAGWSEKCFLSCVFLIFAENVGAGNSGMGLGPRACGSQQH